MKLVSAQITNYRSVEDSNPFRVDESTCLVGKNEAGKSALLTALSALNPHTSTPVLLDRERDYPRRYLTQYNSRHGGEEAEVVRTIWQLDKSEVAVIDQEWGQGTLKSNCIVVSRRYGDSAPRVDFTADFSKAVEYLLSEHKFDAAERSQMKTAGNTSDLKTALEGLRRSLSEVLVLSGSSLS